MNSRESALNLAWLLFPLAIALGVLIGYARGGRVSRVMIPWSFTALVLLALGLQASVGRASQLSSSSVLTATYALAALGLVLVWRAARSLRAAALARFAVAALVGGTVLNGTVIASNGGMPVSRHALEKVGQSASDVSGGLLRKHVEVVPETRLYVLADIIPIPPLRSVVSLGDLIFLLGVGALVAASMEGARHGGSSEASSSSAARSITRSPSSVASRR